MHWLLIVACGPLDTAIDRPDIAVWSHLTAASGLLMVLQAPGTAWILRGRGAPFWRRRGVLVPAALGALALGFVVGIVTLADGATADYAWLVSVVAVCAVLTALLCLCWGVLYVRGARARGR